MTTATSATTKRRRGPWGADGYFSAGLIAGIVTVVLALAMSGDKPTALAITYAGGALVSLFLLIGAVAKGVEAGIRASRD